MEGIGLAMAAQEFASRYYGSGGNVGGVLSTDRHLPTSSTSASANLGRTPTAACAAHEVAILEHGLSTSHDHEYG